MGKEGFREAKGGEEKERNEIYKKVNKVLKSDISIDRKK